MSRCKKTRFRSSLLLTIACLAIPLFAQAGQVESLVQASGGQVASSHYQLELVLGAPAIGRSTSSTKAISLGFLPAAYQARTYNLTIWVSHGKVTTSVSGTPTTTTSFCEGTQVELTATADTGYSFTSWSGGLSGSTNPATITMDSDKTITANFSLNTQTITASSGPGGTISPSGAVSVNYGSDQSFTITPDAHYSVAQVLVDGSSVTLTGNTYTFSKVTQDHTISVSFQAEPQDTIAPTGSIQINDGATYTNATTVSLTFSAQDNPGGNGLSQMRFSNDNSTWTVPESFATTKSWTLLSGDGTKTAYVQFSDLSDNWSEAYSASIILDTTPPQITGISPKDRTTYYENDKILISPIVNNTDSSPLEYQFSIDGIIRQAWSNLSSYSWITISEDKGNHNIKVEVRDIAGQDAEEIELYIFRRPLSPP